MLKKILLFLLVILVIGGIFGYQKYQEIFAPNTFSELEDPYLLIPTNTSFDELKDLLYDKKIVLDTASFVWVANQMSYKKQTVRSGRYKIEAGWSNRELVSHLRNGKQATVKLVLNNERLPKNVAAKAASFIEADSASIYSLLTDKKYLSEIGYEPETVMSLFIPNTYDFFWNKDAKDFMQRMLKEHEGFWAKKDREKKAKEMKLTKKQVYTLASIVEKETLRTAEKPRIAGVYLNRIKKGMKLQADPTVVFATGQFDLRRVLNKHLQFDSPYNTYMYEGLPPGPISMASISSIDAVLNSEDHKFIYFCAKPDNSGYHAFAKSLAGHNQNANRYRRWLSKRGIR